MAEADTSAFRDTCAIVVASFAADVVALGLIAAARGIAPNLTPDIGALVREGGPYLKEHYGEFAAWGLTLLLLACGTASVTAVPPHLATKIASSGRFLPQGLAHQVLRRERKPILPDSGWSFAFHHYSDAQTYVGVSLDDGTYLLGPLLSFSPQLDESGDRDLLLSAPIQLRWASDDEVHLVDADSLIVSASRIKFLTVHYLDVPSNSR